MIHTFRRVFCVAASLLLSTTIALAAPAIVVLGRDFQFPNVVEGLPARLSDFKDLQINSFETTDGVKLSYWEAGQGKPLVFVPGWSANGAEYINVMFLLAKTHHVYVIDPRNQGLSQNVEFGTRIARFGTDLKEFIDHIGADKTDICGWSMGASVVWSYVDLFGTQKIRKAAFIDEPVSIYTHADWSEQERVEAGGMTTSPERMIAAFGGAPTNDQVVDMNAMHRYMENGSKAFQNSEAFARAFMKSDHKFMSLVLFDHAVNDWRDVIQHKINVPTAIFTGENSNNVPSQKWMNSVIPGSELYIYSAQEQGDHFLAFKNPTKFTTDLTDFLAR
ncbi:pimeloyl-ACP methyl ester carboxylesterase [Rhizobium sp. PP-WC-2G-219]|nr:pimeloyl-ACP methyl ester carboxylesterase [Rhizobium sp. PP-WC-2G-219]